MNPAGSRVNPWPIVYLIVTGTPSAWPRSPQVSRVPGDRHRHLPGRWAAV